MWLSCESLSYDFASLEHQELTPASLLYQLLTALIQDMEMIGHETSLSPSIFIFHGTLTQNICSPTSNPYSKTGPEGALGASEGSHKSFLCSLIGRGQGRLFLFAQACPFSHCGSSCLVGGARVSHSGEALSLCVALVFSPMLQALGVTLLRFLQN